MLKAILGSIGSYFKYSSDISILKYNKYHVYSASWIGSMAHPIFWFLWTYIDPQQSENIYLRSIGTALSMLVLFVIYHKEKRYFKEVLPICWLIMIFYNLPFFFTMNLIANEFSSIWLMAEIVMIFVTIILIPNIIYSTIFIISGFYLAIVFSEKILQIGIAYTQQEFFSHSPIYLLALMSANIFNYATIAGNRSSERAKIFKSLSGSIAHELRNPLNSISFIGSNIKELVESINKNNYEQKIKEVVNLSNNISKSVMDANNIINIILDDISEKEIDKSKFENIEVSKFLDQLVDKFIYDDEKNKNNNISTNIKEEYKNTSVSAIPERFSFIIYNLLKNSLYYLEDYPDSKITIGVEEKEYKGENYTSIYVHDTGPGIHPDVLPKLFDDFFTSGKKGGTGLGLAFCKRNMQIFGGDIICESEYGKWTKFSLLFPINETLKDKNKEISGKKIFIVDDEKTNLLIAKSKIERNLPNVSCITENDTKKALSMILSKEQDFDLILSDFEMPEMDGYNFSQQIRQKNFTMPIIIYSSKRPSEFLGKLDFRNAPFSQYLRKDVKTPILCRSIAKWLLLKDSMDYMGEKDEYSKHLKGKTILIADDEELNRKAIKRRIENQGASVIEAKSGKELLETYMKNTDADGKTSIDTIISDINMPGMSGDEVAKEIRTIEIQRGVHHSKRVPIIAVTGDGDEKNIKKYLDCKMTDYYIKGSDPELIIKMIANYLDKF